MPECYGRKALWSTSEESVIVSPSFPRDEPPVSRPRPTCTASSPEFVMEMGTPHDAEPLARVAWRP